METKVVNIKKCKDVDYVYIGRPSKWGNPFIIGIHGTRVEVIQKYKEWLLNKPNLLKELHTLKGKKLGCYCNPKPCHGDVIVDLIEKGDKEDGEN